MHLITKFRRDVETQAFIKEMLIRDMNAQLYNNYLNDMFNDYWGAFSFLDALNDISHVRNIKENVNEG